MDVATEAGKTHPDPHTVIRADASGGRVQGLPTAGRLAMKSYAIGSLAAASLVAGLLGGQPAIGQSPDTVEGHIAAAKAAAGTDHVALFESLCRPAPGPGVAAAPRPAPARSTWYVEPVKA